jgi:hypothetical protein
MDWASLTKRQPRPKAKSTASTSYWRRKVHHHHHVLPVTGPSPLLPPSPPSSCAVKVRWFFLLTWIFAVGYFVGYVHHGVHDGAHPDLISATLHHPLRAAIHSFVPVPAPISSSSASTSTSTLVSSSSSSAPPSSRGQHIPIAKATLYSSVEAMNATGELAARHLFAHNLIEAGLPAADEDHKLVSTHRLSLYSKCGCVCLCVAHPCVAMIHTSSLTVSTGQTRATTSRATSPHRRATYHSLPLLHADHAHSSHQTCTGRHVTREPKQDLVWYVVISERVVQFVKF